MTTPKNIVTKDQLKFIEEKKKDFVNALIRQGIYYDAICKISWAMNHIIKNLEVI